MPSRVPRRAILRSLVPAVAAAGGCLETVSAPGRCEHVSIVKTELEQRNGGSIGGGMEILLVTVAVSDAGSYTLVGRVETKTGTQTVERNLDADAQRQTFHFGPYQAVTAFEFHIEDCSG